MDPHEIENMLLFFWPFHFTDSFNSEGWYTNKYVLVYFIKMFIMLYK